MVRGPGGGGFTMSNRVPGGGGALIEEARRRIDRVLDGPEHLLDGVPL